MILAAASIMDIATKYQIMSMIKWHATAYALLDDMSKS